MQLWQWVDPDGGVLDLEVEWDVDGYLMGSVVTAQQRVPGALGSRYRHVTIGVAETDLLVTVRGATETGLWDNIEQLLDAMNPLRGVGRLRVTTDTRVRERTGIVTDGLGGKDKLGRTAGPLMLRFPITVRHDDPLWRPQTAVRTTITQPASASSFFPFSLPWRIGTATQFGVLSIDNPGVHRLWPVFELDGPFTSVMARNDATGQSWTFTRSTSAGETVIVDTREGHKSVTLQDGSDVFTLLAGRLWPLERGTTQITVDIAAHTSDTAVRIDRWPGYHQP